MTDDTGGDAMSWKMLEASEELDELRLLCAGNGLRHVFEPIAAVWMDARRQLWETHVVPLLAGSYALALLALQSNRYADDPEYREAVNGVLDKLAQYREDG